MKPVRKGGLVVLVGGGPGRESLLTLAGREWLSLADVVVYDRLVNPALLHFCHQRVRKVYVGKAPGASGVPQSAINQLLLRHARAGRLVVRLKGGDGFLFGRGGEEAEALARAHVPYRVVPGITAAIAAGAYAGIPLTDRRLASTVAFVTGQEDAGKRRSRINWRALAAMDTLVFYMGLANLRRIADRLLRAGRDPATPAAVVALASTPRQQTITARLEGLAAAAERAGIRTPAVVIIGQVARLRRRLAWFEHLPLFGKTVVVCRPHHQAAELSRRLTELAAEVIEAPTIQIRPPRDFAAVDAALRGLAGFDWVVFTSVNGVEAFVARCRHLHLDARALARTKAAAIGPATAEALRRNFIAPDLVPATFTSRALARALLRRGVAGRRILLARADVATPDLGEALRSAEAKVQEVAFYRTFRVKALPAEAVSALKAGRVHWIAFTSSSTVENFLALASALGRPRRGAAPRRGAIGPPYGIPGNVKLAAIGPATARTLRQFGLSPAAVAKEHTLDGLVRAMMKGV